MPIARHGCILFAVLVLVGGTAELPVAAAEKSATVEASDTRAEVYALLMRAVIAQRQGEYKSAAGDIRRAIELRPDDPAVLIQGAELFERIGRLKEAEELARQALALDPDNIEALWFVADRAAAAALGTTKPDPRDRDEALRLYERLSTLGVDDPELQRKVVGLKLQAGDQAGALRAARQLVDQRPGDRHAVGMLAQLLLDSGEPREALRVLVRFIVDHPNDSPLIRLAEELAQDLDAWEVVEQTFAEKEGFEDRAVEAQRLRGQALLRLERMGPASRALEKVLVTDPTDRNVRYHLARAYRRMGRLGEAADLARGLAEETPADRGTHLLLAEILDDQGDVEGALNAYNTVLRLFTTEDGSPQAEQVREAVRRRMALLYMINDQPSAAGAQLDASEQPDAPETLQIRARLAIDQQQWTEGKQVVRKLRGAGEGLAADLLEAEIYLRTDKAARAQPLIDGALQAGGNGPRPRLAAILLDTGRVEEGRRLLEEWVENDPEDADARFQLATYLYQADRIEQSEQTMREVFRLAPDHAQALNFLGYSYAERGVQLDQALEMVRRALELDAWNGAYLDSLGWVYYQMGRYQEARDPLEQAARTYPYDPTVLDHLGDLYAKLGEPEFAIAAWSRAIEAGAERPEVIRSKIEVIEVAAQETEGGGSPVKPHLDDDETFPLGPNRLP
jgi:tetratricopeptide (TPR) repeat protein